MPRYIDADKIFYRERMTVFYNSKPIKEDVAFKQDIENVQTEDVAPVVHAHWTYEIDDLFPVDSMMICSNCGEYERLGANDNYCGNCGAKMDEEVEEENK